MGSDLLIGSAGTKSYEAKAYLFIDESRASKLSGLAAIEQRQVVVPATANSPIVAGVFDAFYSALRRLFPNTTDQK